MKMAPPVPRMSPAAPRPRLACLVLCGSLLLPAGGSGCRSDVLLGEQDIDASGDAEAGPDAEQDADGQDAEAEPLTCVEAMVCVTSCGEDAPCALGCAARVCPAGAEPFVALRDCALPLCAPECADFGSASCQTCVGTHCAPSALRCLDASC